MFVIFVGGDAEGQISAWRLVILRFFCGFSQSFKQIPGYYLKICHNQFYMLSNLSFTNHLTIQCCI